MHAIRRKARCPCRAGLRVVHDHARHRRDDAHGAIVGGPGPDGGKALYVAVHDVDALHDRVAASGVRIEGRLVDRDYGSREFVCRDPEGNLWCFGTYWPKGRRAGMSGGSARERETPGRVTPITGCRRGVAPQSGTR